MKTEIKDFKGIINDRNFKVFFKSEGTLQDFLNSYFEFIKSDKHVSFNDSRVQQLVMAPKKVKKDFYLDCITSIDNGEIFLIESYTTFGRREFKKSSNYLARVYSNQMNFGDKDYSKCKKCTCLNLMFGNYLKSNPYLINSYIPKNKITNVILDDGEQEMVLIRLDLINNSLYSGNNKRFIRWLKIINAKSFEEMEKLAKGDKIMERSIEYIKWYHENIDNGFQDIIDEEVFLAKEDERKETKLDIAKNLISLDINIKDIMKATGLSEKQIKKLQN